MVIKKEFQFKLPEEEAELEAFITRYGGELREKYTARNCGDYFVFRRCVSVDVLGVLDGAVEWEVPS